MVGGGPVYLDDGQLFFQIAVPVSAVSPVRARALRQLLEPAVDAFRAVGVPADLDDTGEIVVGDAKICGHGAGQIGEAVVVVGNLIERFDHDAASAVLAAPSPAARAEALRLMRRYVVATPTDAARFQAAAISAYATALGLAPRPGRLRPGERTRLAQLDRKFCERHWVRGPARPAPAVWQAKVRAGVWVLAAQHQGAEVVVAVVRDHVERAQVADAELNGSCSAVELALVGTRLTDAAEVLAPFGRPGTRVAAALAKGDRRRL
jgi:lipoate-protein ligase A